MANNRLWRAIPGDIFDNEGFPIITSASTLRAHIGRKAGIWPEAWPFTSSVDAMIRQSDGRIVLYRDGKGDTLEFDLDAAYIEATPVYLSGRQVAMIRLFDAETGFYRPDGAIEVSMFHRITAGLVALGNAFII